MYKKIMLSMFLVIFLTACGQVTEQVNQEDKAESVEIETASQAEEEKEQDSSSDTEKAEEATKETAETSNTNTDNHKAGDLPKLNVHYIDVGQADATLFQYGNHSILFDTGDWRGDEVVTYLQSQGISKLDLVIGSHPDADHIGQLANVMKSFTVSEVWLSGNESTSQTFQRGLEAVLDSGANYHEPRTGEEFSIGDMDLTVLYPESITGAANEESISVLFTYGGVKFLFTGDADQQAERRMMNTGITIDADILQLGHHGSNTSSDPSFIAKVSPAVAIYSAGAGNSYGHPHAEVVSRIQQAGITLYGTDVHGTIIVTTDGNDYSIITKTDGTITPKSSGKSTDSGSSAGSGSTSNSSSGSSSSASNSNTSADSGSSTNSSKTKKTEPKQSAPSAGCVNINSASVEAVQQIIHIGPERAQDLINLRPFSSVRDLDRISGIGPARIKDIQAQGLACVN